MERADNQSFKEITNFVKFHYKFKMSDIFAKIGLSDNEGNALRRGARKMDKQILQKIVQVFPKVKNANFSSAENLSENDVEYSYKSNPYKKLSEALEENNAYLKEKVKKLEMENSRLKAENYKLKNG